MSDLHLLQNQFQNYLINDQNDIHHSIVNTEKVPIQQRLTIYQEAYYARLLDSLISNYPILHQYLGDEAFSQVGYDYISRFPSPYRSIRWFGDNFAAYFKEMEEDYLKEIAELEWKMTLVFDAPDAETLKVSDMATISPEVWPNLSFVPHPSLQRMDCTWNSVEIWEAIARKQEPNDPKKESDSFTWIIWRKDYLNYYKKIEEEESWALDALSRGATFSEICEGLCEWNEENEIGFKAASLLKGWIEAGLIKEVKENAL